MVSFDDKYRGIAMREIKFRAWDTKSNRFLDENDNVPNFLNLVPSDSTGEFRPMYMYIETVSDIYGSDCILMQYTGLKDKNGKEIYEGDIVKFSGSLAKHTTKVVYDAPEFMFEDVNRGARLSAARVSDIRISQFNPQQYEVIGNIHENPELLKSEASL